jgi:hypothetical protein
MTNVGRRKPRPIGPAMPPAAEGSVPVRYSPGVPGGGVGGVTWSKKPPFSSYVMNKTVLFQTSGLEARASRRSYMYWAPAAGRPLGCSLASGWTHETWGRSPLRISSMIAVFDRSFIPFSYSGESLGAVWNCLNHPSSGPFPPTLDW